VVVGAVIGSDETVVVLCVVVVAGAGCTTRSERNEQPAANMLAAAVNKRIGFMVASLVLFANAGIRVGLPLDIKAQTLAARPNGPTRERQGHSALAGADSCALRSVEGSDHGVVEGRHARHTDSFTNTRRLSSWCEGSVSPWMRGAPHKGLAMLILRIRSRVSLGVLGRPGWPDLDRHRQ
jgi:hypothetical protein